MSRKGDSRNSYLLQCQLKNVKKNPTYTGYWTGRNREILKIEGNLSPEQFEIEKAWARGPPRAQVGSSAVHCTQL